MKRPSLRSLSDNQLLARIEAIRRREHRSTLDILTHLNEIDRRKLYLRLGYGSLFDYCVKHLGYSTSGAGRRIAVARCAALHPEVMDMLRSRAATMSGVALVASVLREDNKTEILENIQNKTQSEIDVIASRYRPPISMRDRDSASPESDKNNTPGPGTLQQKLLIQFLANKDFIKKYEEVRVLLSQRLTDTSFESVFEALLEEFLARHCPLRRKRRRDQRSQPMRATGNGGQSHMIQPAAVKANTPARRARHIPAAVRDQVFARYKGRCAYVGKTGKRCESTQALQIDHIQPFCRGGTHAASNLRLLCAQHNRLAARDLLGNAHALQMRQRE